MEDRLSFEYILPSNVSLDQYPNNTPSCFTTAPQTPIVLKGDWEVGVKSLFYNSHIGDVEEEGEMKLSYAQPLLIPLIKIYPLKYKITKDMKWDYGWQNISTFYVIPKATETEGDRWRYLSAIAKSGNQWNAVLATDVTEIGRRKRNVFTFSSDQRRLLVEVHSYGIYIKFTPRMSKFLGLNPEQPFLRRSWGNRQALNIEQNPKELQSSDYKLAIFDCNVIKPHAHIVLKAKGETLLSQEEFLKRWETHFSKQQKVNVETKFVDGKLQIHIGETNIGLLFNNCLHDSIHFNEAIFGRGIYHGSGKYGQNNDGMKPETDEWIVVIYKDELRTISLFSQLNEKRETFKLYPRKATVSQLMATANRQMLNFANKYGIDHKSANLTPTSTKQSVVKNSAWKTFSMHNNFTKVSILPHLKIELSSNVAAMLGFPQQHIFTGGEKPANFVSSHLPATLDKREQEICILSDVINLMNYGTEKRQILQQFVHNKDAAYGIVGKVFDPIIYQPVAKTMIDRITIQLVDNFNQHPLPLKDSKTTVTLHFRRVR